MAEAFAVVGFTSAILDLVTFGAKVVVRLEDFQRRTGDVPKAFKSIHVQLPLLMETLEQTSTQLEASCVSKDKQLKIENVLQDCHSQLGSLYTILEKTLPTNGDGSFRRGWKAFSSLHQEGQVDQITKTLASHVQQLTYYHVSATSQPPTTEAKAMFMIPFMRDVCFIDREDIMKDIHQKLGMQKRIALSGIGGVGKSQIAIEYCYRYRDANPSHSVFWVYAGTVAKFDQAYKDIARSLILPGWDAPEANVLQLVADWLDDQRHGHWLLVIDNADDSELFFGPKSRPFGEQTEQTVRLFRYLPKSPKGSIIVTTRDKRVGELICDSRAAISVPILDSQKSKAMLQSKIPENQWNTDDAQCLLTRLDDLPLAITQAAAFIRNNSISIQEYLEILHKSELGVAGLLSEDLTDPRRDLDAPNSVVRTWKVSFDQIRRQEPKAADLLALMAVLDRQGIPKTLLSKQGENIITFTSALGTLLAFSLITAETGGTSFEMHRLVQLSTRKWLEFQGEIMYWQQEALLVLSREFPNGEYKTWAACETLSPHAQTVLQYTPPESNLTARAALLRNMAEYELERGQYEVAFVYSSEAHTIREEQLGITHVDTLDSADALARILMEQGKYKEAEKMQRGILQERKSTLGLEHEDTLRSMNLLGRVLYHQGSYEAAERLYRQVLVYGERSLGLHHLETIISKNSLAYVLTDQGRYEAAEQLHRQVLEDQEKLGLQHPLILECMTNLAFVIYRQEKYEAAEQMLRQVLEIRERTLGPHHPRTLVALNNLALVLIEQGRIEAAEQIFRQVLEIREKTVGPQNPDTLIAVYNLAALLRDQRRYEEVETMLQQALKVAENSQGLVSLATLRFVNEFAYLRYDQGDLSQAIGMMQRAHDGYQEAFGDSHPNTRWSAKALSQFLAERDKTTRGASAMMGERNALAHRPK